MPPVVGGAAEVEERRNGYPSSRSPGEDHGHADGPDAAHTQCVGGSSDRATRAAVSRCCGCSACPVSGHATEDKEFVRPLAYALIGRGIDVWFDEAEIRVGDSLRETIDHGLARSRFGVVVLSASFFAKRWTSYELNGLVAREMRGRKVVLPVWHPEMTIDLVLEHSPTLADMRALVAADLSADEIADELVELVRGGA
jgi:hypothetical protein